MSPTHPHREADEALAAAAEAATRSQVSVQDLHDPTHLRAASHLFDTVWGRGSDTGAMVPPEVLTALARAGGQVSGAFREGELVGATAAFVGLSDAGETHLHSHVTGVLPSVAGTGVGRAMKLHQRAWCLTRGLTRVVWTFDPLVRRNAVFNLVLLGAQAVDYHRDAYGPMSDARNAGLPTDRLVAEWDLLGPRVRAALGGRPAEPDVAALRRGGAQVAVDVGGDGEPVITPTDRPRRLVRVPEDIEALREADPDSARHWSEAIRAELGDAMATGMRVTGFTRDGWYLLATRGGVRELSEER